MDGAVSCPSCGFRNRPEAGFCGECGRSLAAKQTCPACGRSSPLGRRFCDGCGEPLRSTAQPTPVRGSTTAPEPVAAPGPTSFASGRYRVKRFLGEGATKRVYLARDERLDRDIAIGLIKTEGLDADKRLRVEREARAMGRLGDHPHIVTVYDVIEEGNDLYLVSEYMPGGDLEERLAGAKDGRLSVRETLQLATELCRALEHAHSQGVIHRDVKPGNVYLSAQGAARLGDFGLAVSLDHSRITREGMIVGTAAYMAPEQALGHTPDARSDLYGLGATLYEMVAGRPPFVGDEAVAVISQHLNTPPVHPSWHNAEVPRPLEALILALLAKDPGQRPASAAAVREALTAIDAAPTSAARPDERAEANPLDRLASGTFVGRERELEQARACLDQGLSGVGQVLLLVGEPGIGKTRTAEELTTYARLRGAQVLWGRCYEGEGAPAHWPWVQIIRSYVHDREPEELRTELGSGAAIIAEVVSEVRERLPDLPAPPRTDPDEARFRLFDGVSSFLDSAARRAPLVLVLDDLHWADEPSLLLLQFLVRELGESRIVVVGTYRDVELSRTHPLEEALAEISRGPHSTRILLRGLTQGDVARFIERAAHVDPPPALVETVYRETEGNPFFVHEVVRLLEADGRLERPERVSSWSLEVPEGIRQVVGRRLNRLTEGCNSALSLASVIGRELELSVLTAVAGSEEDRLVDLLDEAVRAHVLEEVEGLPGKYRFAHALVRETLYEELSTTRRVRLHRRIGEALERIHAGRPEPHLSQLAYHFCESASEGERARAIDYAVRAAERATAQYGYEEAAAHYERALAVLELDEPVDGARQGELLLALGIAHGDSGRPERAQAVFQRALAVARSSGSGILFARAASQLAGHVHLAGTVPPELESLVEEALSLLPDGDSPERAQVLAVRALLLLITSPSASESAAVLDQAREMATRVGDDEALSFAAQFGACQWPRPAADRLDDVRQGLAIAERGEFRGAARMGAYFLFMRIALQVELGDADAVDADIAAIERQAAQTRHHFDEWAFKQAQAMRAMMIGSFEEAERLASEAFALRLKFNEGNALQYFGFFLFMLRILQGRLAELDASVRDPFGAVSHVFLGEEAEAREYLESDFDRDLHALPQDYLLPARLSGMADIVVFLGDRPRAALVYERILPYADRVFPGGLNAAVLGPGARLAGGLAALLERWEEAERHFESALETSERTGARPWLARTQQDFATMLLARDDPGDRERAFALATRALDTAKELGMAQLVEQALATKLAAQGAQSGDAQGSIHAVSSAIRERRPDLTPHAAPDGTVTLMFSDMEGFTAMTERLGDLRAREVIRRHNAIVREQLAKHGGYEVELQGDGFLLAFQSARQALLCSIALQRAFTAHNKSENEPIRVRIGLHTGEALKDADKFFGKTVILASRIADQAAAGEILVSALLKGLVESAGDVRFGAARDVDLKGISERQRLFKVEWQ